MRILFALLVASILAACTTQPESISSHPGQIGGEQAAKQNNLQPID
jgi:uncharacterized lipoprotein YajG